MNILIDFALLVGCQKPNEITNSQDLKTVPKEIANGVLADEPPVLTDSQVASSSPLTETYASPPDEPTVLTDSQVASLNCLTIDENRILVVARPDMARRLDLTPQQTHQIQAMVVEFVELKYGPEPKYPPLSQKAREVQDAKDDFPSNGLSRETIERMMKSVEDELAPTEKAVRDRYLRLRELQDKLPTEVESLLTTAQKESFQCLQPKDIPAAKVLAKVTFEIPTGQTYLSSESIGTGFALSPDEKTLAVGGAGNVLLYSVPDGAPIGTLPVEADGKQRTPFKVAFASDGKKLIVLSSLWPVEGSQTTQVAIWELAPHALVKQFWLNVVAIAPDLSWIAGVNWPCIDIYSGETGAKLATVTLQTPAAAQHNVNCLTVSPDGTKLAIAVTNSVSHSCYVALWNTHDWSFHRQFKTIEGSNSPNCMVFSPDGGRLAAGWKENTIQMMSATYSNRVFNGSVRRPGLVRLWSVDSGEEQTVLYDLRPEILQFSKSGSQLVCNEFEKPFSDGPFKPFNPPNIAVWDLTRNDKQVVRHPSDQYLGRLDGIIPLSNGQILLRNFLERENKWITISLLSDRTD